MLDFIIGLVSGVVLVGTSTLRTIKIYDGKYVSVALLSFLVTVSYLPGIKYASSESWWGGLGYVGFSLGASIVTTYTAYRRKNKQDEG